ncbi:DUF4453 domain-containing protein [Roseovarius rhodophyticola]|uniref:DUF4453 domain-containing protein n=1 Tax=Roseovarius rhodophyticola TaxID=3080827 RepID=A0ABZ2TG79_9RHOB|nr:DUF4453 domain-containing protein [Roseovarius sp. W115]
MQLSLGAGPRARQNEVMRIVLLLLAFVASSASANEACEDVWFTRNLIFDRAGYCFGSTLGQAVFDNSNCIGTSVSIPPDQKRIVDEIRALEAQHGCQVDTGRTGLRLIDAAIRRQLRDLPIRDEFESGCLGWLGPVVPLHAGHDNSSAVIGRVEPGDYILYSHLGRGGWSYVTTHTANWTSLKSGGWMRQTGVSDASCAQWAG